MATRRTNPLLYVFIAAGLFWAWRNYQPPIGDRLAPDNKVVMYSLTTCGYCKQRAADFRRLGIPFKEVMIDNDQALQNRLIEQAMATGEGGVGTPIIDVNGTLLPNNPPLREIKKYLHFKS